MDNRTGMAYSFAWDQIHSDLEFLEATRDERIDILKFMMAVVKADLFGDTTSQVLFRSKDAIADIADDILSRYVPDNREKTTIEFAGRTILTAPYDMEKLIAAGKDIAKDGFRQERGNYRGHYYPELELVVIHDGRHHSALASLFAKGSADVEVCPLTSVFGRLTTDGYWWYEDGTRGDRVQDSRLALLYSLAREVDELQNGCSSIIGR